MRPAWRAVVRSAEGLPILSRVKRAPAERGALSSLTVLIDTGTVGKGRQEKAGEGTFSGRKGLP